MNKSRPIKYAKSHRPIVTFLATVLTLAQMGFGVVRVAAYDLSTDYSPTSNPNGVWSYGAMTNLGGPLPLFNVHSSPTSDNGVPVDVWAFGSFNPAIIRNSTANTAISDGGAGVYPPGTVTLFPGGNGVPYAFGVARFTVPSGGAGSYLLQTTVHTYLNGPSSGDTDFHVLKNGVQLFGQFMPANSGTNFTTNLNLSAGDKIDFAAGRGLDGNGDASGIKIQASLTLIFCSPHHATAIASNINGFIVGVNILDPGCGYTNPPLVLIQGGGGLGATATATINDGKVTAINIINPGSGYTNAPKILIASPPFVPTVEIGVSKVKVTQHVVLGLNYVLEASTDLVNWTATGPPFTASDETIVTEFDVDLTGRYFRIRQVP